MNKKITLPIPDEVDKTLKTNIYYVKDDKGNEYKVSIHYNNPNIGRIEKRCNAGNDKIYPLWDKYQNFYLFTLDDYEDVMVVDVENRTILSGKQKETIINQFRITVINEQINKISNILRIKGTTTNIVFNKFLNMLKLFTMYSDNLLNSNKFYAVLMPKNSSIIISHEKNGYLSIYIVPEEASFDIHQITSFGGNPLANTEYTENNVMSESYYITLKINNPLNEKVYEEEVEFIDEYVNNIQDYNKHIIEQLQDIENIIIVGFPSPEEIEEALSNLPWDELEENGVDVRPTIILDVETPIDILKTDIENIPEKYQKYIQEIFDYIQENPKSYLASIVNQSLDKINENMKEEEK